MRLAELLDKLSGLNPDDIVAIGVYIGKRGEEKQFNSEPISEIVIGDGIALLYTGSDWRYHYKLVDPP